MIAIAQVKHNNDDDVAIRVVDDVDVREDILPRLFEGNL